MINRCAVMVRARKPFQDWLKGLPKPAHYSLESINEDNSVYLLPGYDLEDERDGLLDHYFDLIFEDQLAGWWTDRRDWPDTGDLDLFRKWFEVEFRPAVQDLVDAPIEDDQEED